MVKKQTKTTTWIGVVAIICAIVLALAMVFLRKSDKAVTDFQTCKNAGGAIMESYPEQCNINGKTFTNSAQSLDGNANEYIGLTEKVALDKASAANKAARVVERDGESLPVDMSFQPGRLNLHIKDDKVSKVDIEGKE
ncbi:MAG TPA: hypothetical protein VGE13_00480 [Candidatus Saccharimonadales bacterium]